MADNVMIKFSADDSGLDEVNQKLLDTKKIEQDLIAQMKQLEQQKNVAKFNAKSAKEQSDAEQKYGKQIENTRKQLKETRKSIEDLSNAQKKLKETLPAETITKSFRTMRREIEEQIKMMEVMEDTGSAEYQRLVVEAGKLNDISGDVSRQIRNQASDTRAFDTIFEGTQLVAGGFSIAQGAMALFGSESEDVQKMMVKLQSAIAITTGLQQVGNAVQKESNIMMGIASLQSKALAAAKAQEAKGTVASTIAQKAFNLVAKANPYVLLAVALIAVVGALYLFSRGARDAEREQKRLNSELSSTSKQIKAINDNSDFDVEIAKAAGKSTEEINKMRLAAAKAANELAYLKMGQVMSNPNATKAQRDEAIKRLVQVYLCCTKPYLVYWNLLQIKN